MSLINLNFKKESVKNQDDVLDGYIKRVVVGDKEALAEIYHMTSSSVYGFALSFLKNMQDAEDVLHDVYLKIYSSAANYKSMGKPMAWILTITRNLCLMKIRDQQKIADLPHEDWTGSFDNLPMVTVEDRVVLESCMGELADEERQIVILHAVAGFKHREVADFLSLPLSTVLSKYNRSLKKLKNIMGGRIR